MDINKSSYFQEIYREVDLMRLQKRLFADASAMGISITALVRSSRARDQGFLPNKKAGALLPALVGVGFEGDDGFI